jgi:phenylalanyl-tRNA synthetase beta chain
VFSSFIDLQDKLHQNICRKRSLVAIGTHDLSTIQSPFSYEALPPEDIKFTPLKQTQEFNAQDLMEFYKSDVKLKQFLPLINTSPVFPVIYDANRTVLSLPPIINGAHSAISLDTRDIFIECTATDLHKASIVLNTMVTMFSGYCTEAFTVEPVDVTDSLGVTRTWPDLSSRTVEVDMGYINSRIGTSLQAEAAANLLTKMCLDTQAVGETLVVKVPPTRSDVLHPCDIMEDVAIAYGYNNLVEEVPKTVTVAKQQPINCFTDLLRAELAMAGFTEVLTFILGSTQV